MTIYTFDDTVPVGIFDEKCTVRFSETYEQVAFLFDI